MIPLPLAWTLLTASMWTAGSSQILLQESIKPVFPAIGSQGTIECDCANISCDSVYWFYSSVSQGKVQFLGKCNNAERVIHGPGVEATRFQFTKTGHMFVLRISKVKLEDAGRYSCVLRGRRGEEIWKLGSLLRPGETPPRPPPKTKPKPPREPVCRCPKKNPPQNGCSSLVLWPLVGLAAAMGLALTCTLYYFSRLPKKCRHHFQKTRQMAR